MKRSRIAVLGTALVVLPVAVGGFMLQRREATDAARLFAQVFARIAADAVDSVAPDAMYEKAARGLVRSLNDPYADLYSPQELVELLAQLARQLVRRRRHADRGSARARSPSRRSTRTRPPRRAACSSATRSCP